MKRINIFATLTMLASVVSAQTQYDAARITGTELNGTARFVGMGGAMGALVQIFLLLVQILQV